MKTFLLLATVATAAAVLPTIKLAADDGSACLLQKHGQTVSSTCNLNSKNIRDLVSKVNSIETALNTLTARVDAQEHTDRVHRRDIDKKAQKGETGSRGLTGAKGSTGAKGNTAQGRAEKPVVLETGAQINAPIFIEEGEMVRVDTEDRKYVGRAND